jgi:hypothetical protein
MAAGDASIQGTIELEPYEVKLQQAQAAEAGA